MKAFIMLTIAAAATIAFTVAAANPTVRLCESIPMQMTIKTNYSTYESWVDIIKSAKKTLDIGQYYWTLTTGTEKYSETHEAWRGQHIYDLIIEAHKRGVAVRIIQNKLGATSEGNETAVLAAIGAADVKTIDFDLLGISGIFHTKMMVADSVNFYVGSANSDWRSLTQVKEMGVVGFGYPEMAQDLQKVFDMAWVAADKGVLPKTWPAAYETKYNIANPNTATFQGLTEVSKVYTAISPAEFCTPQRTDVIESTLDVIRKAEKGTTVSIEVMDYFPFTLYVDNNYYWGVIDDALRDADYRGVKVRLLIGKWAHTRYNAKYYLRSLNALPHIEVRWFSVPELKGLETIPYTRVNHAKFMTTKDTAYISTSNWSADYFLFTHGVTVVVNGKQFADTLNAVFERDWNSEYASSVELDA